MGGLEHWTVAELERRLGEIAEADARHAERDLDAELAEVMRKGGDIDALEEAQLAAERAVRRLRVERVALEQELPEARKREGAERVAALAKEHADLRSSASELERRLTATWTEFLAAVQAWGAVQRRALVLTEDASREAGASGAAMPPLGTFRSFVVEELSAEIHRHQMTISGGLHQPTSFTGHGLQSCELDAPASTVQAA